MMRKQHKPLNFVRSEDLGQEPIVEMKEPTNINVNQSFEGVSNQRNAFSVQQQRRGIKSKKFLEPLLSNKAGSSRSPGRSPDGDKEHHLTMIKENPGDSITLTKPHSAVMGNRTRVHMKPEYATRDFVSSKNSTNFTGAVN